MDDMLISGNGDNSLLICAKDNCEWTQSYPMAEPLSAFIQAATNHINESHKD